MKKDVEELFDDLFSDTDIVFTFEDGTEIEINNKDNKENEENEDDYIEFKDMVKVERMKYLLNRHTKNKNKK